MTVINTIRKGQFCVVRRNHTAAFVGGLNSQYTTFEIVRAEKTNKAGQVTEVRTESNSPLKSRDWAYCYAIPEHQAEADRLFDNGESVCDSLSDIKAALTKTKQDILDAAVHAEERRTERALGL